MKELDNVSLVFDIDDTICNNKNRDYENAIPYTDVVSKINDLHKKGAHITLYTSRGMKSCNGDIDRIIAKNKDILEKWLKKNKVKYDELVFGKPLGDLYVDDKALNVRDFVKEDFGKLNGRSGYSVTRIGNIVKKEMTEDNYKKVMNWYKDSTEVAKSPKIISNLYTTIYMEYINGKSANKVISRKLLNKLIQQILIFKDVKCADIDRQILIEKTNKHKSRDKEWNELVEDCINKINNLDIEQYASLGHGDFTLANIIVKDNELYLLDSQYNSKASSYLLDFAKLKMSLDGYEERFCNGSHINKRYSKMLARKLKRLGIYKEVVILEYMWIIRLHNYNKDNIDKLKEFAKEVKKEIERW